jgi:sarcosine oxidase subunit gamma
MSPPLQEATSLAPENFPERAPLDARHSRAVWRSIGHAALVDRYDDEAQDIGPCALADLTNLPRLGLRGKAAADFFTAQGYRVPDAPNRLARQDNGTTLLRLSQNEFMCLGPVDSPADGLADGSFSFVGADDSWSGQTGIYSLPRQDSHAWFWLGGSRIHEVMAKLCGVDLRPGAFASGAIAQTSVARINAIVANTGSAAFPVFQLLFDRPSAAYFWDALLDAMQEFGGHPAGFAAILRYGQTA